MNKEKLRAYFKEKEDYNDKIYKNPKTEEQKLIAWGRASQAYDFIQKLDAGEFE